MQLSEYRKVWETKPVVRKIYADFYSRIRDRCVSGTILEIGGGSGNLKHYLKDIISLDIQVVPWLDAVADAQYLSFSSNSFDNIILIDVLHHIESSTLFFKEACRVLRNNGRIIMLEPAITPLSWIFYNYLHEEPVLMSDNQIK